MTRAADLLVETLKAEGVDRVFCVPGESYLAVIDALHDAPGIDVVNCRHEGGGGFMAVADAKMTGRPGVLFVSRGPGAMNAAMGVHVAEQDAAPLVLFVGQVARADLGRGAFQEVDYVATFGAMAKLCLQVMHGDDLAAAVRRAFAVAGAETPGPVVVALPEDMLDDQTNADIPAKAAAVVIDPEAAVVADICARLAAAERPLLIAGGQIRGEAGRRALLAVAEAWQVPVAVSWRRQDLFDHGHASFAGHLGFNMPKVYAETLNHADLIIAIGTRLGDVVTQGYTIPTAPRPKQPLVHVHPDAGHLGRVFATDLAVAADAGLTLAAIARTNAPPIAAHLAAGRAAWIAEAHALPAERMAWETQSAEDGVVFGAIVAELARTADQDAVLAIDAGNFSTWAHRHFPFTPAHTQLAAVAGAMGMGVPAAVAGGLRNPGRQVICLVGDGGFQMTGFELMVAVERQLAVKVFVSNNASYGTIRLYQERAYPGRTKATDLKSPGFAALAEAFGATGMRIEKDADVAPVVARALAAPGPVVVEVMASLEYLSAYVRISELG